MAKASSSTATGLVFGLAAVLAWAVYNIGVAEGRKAGFSILDLTFLRYFGATLALAPVAIWRLQKGGAVPARGRILALFCFAGPHFGLLYNLAMPLTRLSHAVIISPGISMIGALTLTSFSLRKAPAASKLVGMAILLAALAMIGADRASGAGPAQPWCGDGIFFVTGSLYGAFSFLLGRWREDAVMVTFWISALSLLVVGPCYAIFSVPTQHPIEAWGLQVILQGVLGGGWAIVLYAMSIRHLGADRAGIFPALVPVVAAILSIPVTKVLPSPLEGLGCGLAALGMYLSIRNPKPAG